MSVVPAITIGGVALERVISVEITKGVSKRFDRVVIKIGNIAGAKTNSYSQFSTIVITNNTYTLFYGRVVETKPLVNNILEITGEDISAKLADREVNESYSAKSINYIITDATYGVMPIYLPAITLTNVTNVTNVISKDFYRVSLMDVLIYLSDVASIDGYDFYINSSGDLHFYPSKTIDSEVTVRNTGVGANLLTWEFPYEGSAIYNRVTVYGDTTVPVLSQVNDQASQELYGIKDMPAIINPTIKTNVDAKERGRRALREHANPYRVGILTVKSSVVESVRPGELIAVDIANSGVSSASYLVLEMTMQYPQNKTKIRVNEWHTAVADILSEMMKTLRKVDIRSVDTTDIINVAHAFDIFTGLTPVVDDPPTQGGIGPYLVGTAIIGYSTAG